MSHSLQFYAPFDANFTEKFVKQLPGTINNSPLITGGKADFTGGPLKYVTFTQALPIDLEQIGAVYFKITPQYSGAPVDYQYLFCISHDFQDASGFMDMYHSLGTGVLTLRIVNASQTAITTATLGVWLPTAGQEYEFEINYDITNGATRVFIDGVQFGATIASTGTRGTTLGFISIGNFVSPQNVTSNFLIRQFAIYSGTLHGSDYTVVTPKVCTVFGIISDLSGQLRAGVDVSFRLHVTGANNTYAIAQNEQVSPISVVATSQSDGTFQMDLIRQNQYENSLLAYEVSLKDGNTLVTNKTNGDILLINVPDQQAVALSDLIPAV